MPSAHLRCHLLIGPPGSGKTTFAGRLAPLLRGDHDEPGLILSTDAIRAELFGDPSFQGPWEEIRAVLLERLRHAIAAGTPVVIDATHARRPWRLLYTQQLNLPRPVEWIGWWLKTPLEICKSWNQQRPVPVPEAVIEDYRSAIGHRDFGPSRAEGFAAIVRLDPAAGETSIEAIQQQLKGLNRVISSSLPRDNEKLLHRYSRLLDLERLLFLLRLLIEYNGLDRSDPGTAIALDQICTPPPQGDLADQAAVYLGRWDSVHGGNNDGYGDAHAIREDLAWLNANGFTTLDHCSDEPLDPGAFRQRPNGGINGGYPAMGDRKAFIRVMSLLRHILQEPFDGPPDGDASTPSAPEPAGKPNARRRRDSDEFGPLYRHLIGQLSHLEDSYAPNQEAVLRRDVIKVLRLYGFLPGQKGKGRPEVLRHGYAIGTALLSKDHLLELHDLLRASMQRLSDASQKPLLSMLEQRLRWGGILQMNESSQRRHSKRALAIRVLTDEPSNSLADPNISGAVERAIRERRRIWLQHRPDIPSDTEQKRLDDKRFRVWPLQLLFYNISWYLAFETHSIGGTDQRGLIRVLRTDRLNFLGHDGNTRRAMEQDHADAMERLDRLHHVCGGLYFGDDIDAQLAVMRIDPEHVHDLSDRQPDLLSESDIRGVCFQMIRFHCTAPVFRLIREEPKRFPAEQTRYSQPLPGDQWTAGPLDTLTPNGTGSSHPYPVQILLPAWTVQHDWDLRNWLFRWGDGVRIESPIELKHRHWTTAQGVVNLYTQPG